ncbi:integrin alpha-5-like [Choristoneura fumiferana]|uniref:integrin alpha-5-like n=1 Tax=Choristoneura fumiferana TaxID=7141 RepID=UPI003D15905C
MRLVRYCVLVRLLAGCTAAYFHELSMTTLQPPLKLATDSFFGYSMTYDGQSKNVVVTAPRADLEGQVFSCDITKNTCSKLDVIPATNNEKYRYDPVWKKEHYHHFWLGASVKADSKNLLVCAPRHTDTLKAKGKNNEGNDHNYFTFGTSGRCYVKDLSLIEPQKFESLLTIKDKDRALGATHNENLTDTFGWSIDIAADHSVRVGSPAISVGRMMTYSNPSPIKSPKLLNGYGVKEQVNFNFGYSIATGNFFEDHQTHIAVSTPFGEFGRGKVIFFDEYNRYRSTIYDDRDLVGTMFGAALCSAVLTHKMTSLLIGAPAFFNKTSAQHRYHTGMVLIYLPDSQTLMKRKGTIYGPKDGGFFGASIANVGDMDKDELDEIAIAAPYENDGRGAVYLYPGSALAGNSDPIPWLQKFQPEKFMNFGLSLSALHFSDNGCNDLAIGAPGNDKVAVYHCIPSVTVHIDARFPLNLQTRKDKTSFEFQSCLMVTYPKKPEKVTARFTVTVRITHPNATLSDKTKDHESYDEVVQSGKTEICRPIKVLTSENGDYEQDIQFDITAQLRDDPVLNKNFDPNKATVSNHSILVFKQSVRAADCKNERCEPKLSLDVKFTAADTYLTGSTAAETLRVVIRNGDGDTAYRPCARIKVEGDVTVLRSPAAVCMFDNVRQRTCQLQGPLASNSEWDIGAETAFELDMTSLNSESRNMSLQVDVFNHCNTSVPAADPQIINVRFKNDNSGIRIEGKTDQGEIVNLTRSDVDVFGKTIHHTYTITNTKGTNWKLVNCTLFLQKNPSIEFQLDTIQVYRDDALSKKCEVRNQTGDTDVVELTCDIGELFKEDSINVVIPFFVPPGKLDGKISETSNITVRTELNLHFDSENEDLGKSVTTTLTLQEALVVPIWIIVVAVLVGLFILGLLAFALYECGFLRRKNKEKLKDLKTDVKRKSMILHRQSMRLSNSARAALANRTYRELLDEADAKEAEEAEVIEDVQEVSEAKEACQPTPSNRHHGRNADFKNQIEVSLKKQLVK